MSYTPEEWREKHTRPGRVAYEAYAAQRGGVTVAGDPMWTWDEMVERDPEVAYAWLHAAQAAISDHEAAQREAHTPPRGSEG